MKVGGWISVIFSDSSLARATGCVFSVHLSSVVDEESIARSVVRSLKDESTGTGEMYWGVEIPLDVDVVNAPEKTPDAFDVSKLRWKCMQILRFIKSSRFKRKLINRSVS